MGVGVRGMSKKKPIYREVQYVVGMRADRGAGEITFFPVVVIDGQRAAGTNDGDQWLAPLGDSQEMSLAFGGAQATCDQLNADLQKKGLNRLREVS